MDRRDFLKVSGGALAALGTGTRGAEAAGVSVEAQSTGPFAAPAIPTVRIAYVGVGGQGSGHVRNLLKIPGCRITAVCDINPERTAWATKAITDAGHPAPAVLERLRAGGAVPFRTDQDGAIVIETDGRGIDVRTWSGRSWQVRLWPPPV